MAFIDESGVFTEDFRTALPEMLGEEHKDSKVFDPIPNLPALAKAYADTKSALGKKLDSVIQRPTKDAKPEDVAAFRRSLAIELGAPETPDKYEFHKPTLPEGEQYDGALEGKIRAVAAKHSVPVAFLKELSQTYNEHQIGVFNETIASIRANQEKAFNDNVTSLKTDDKWLGDNFAKNLRIVLKTIDAFGSDDLKNKIKAAGLFDKVTPESLKDWQKAGINIDSIPFFLNVGSKLLSAELLQSAGGGGGTETELEKAKRLHPNRSELWPKT